MRDHSFRYKEGNGLLERVYEPFMNHGLNRS
jgi:hypothetical protein